MCNAPMLSAQRCWQLQLADILCKSCIVVSPPGRWRIWRVAAPPRSVSEGGLLGLDRMHRRSVLDYGTMGTKLMKTPAVFLAATVGILGMSAATKERPHLSGEVLTERDVPLQSASVFIYTAGPKVGVGTLYPPATRIAARAPGRAPQVSSKSSHWIRRLSFASLSPHQDTSLSSSRKWIRRMGL